MKKVIIILIILLIAVAGFYMSISKDIPGVNDFSGLIKEVKFRFLPEKCKEQAISSGDCFGMSSVYQYNKEKGVCEISYGFGCDIFSPFKTLEECKNICE